MRCLKRFLAAAIFAIPAACASLPCDEDESCTAEDIAVEEYALNSCAGYTSVNGHVYKAVSTPATFSAALHDCRLTPGADLVSITSLAQNAEVRGLLSGTIRIGLFRAYRSVFKWTDGTGMTYQNWAPGRPGYGSTQCATLGADGKWTDGGCNDLQAYVCECNP